MDGVVYDRLTEAPYPPDRGICGTGNGSADFSGAQKYDSGSSSMSDRLQEGVDALGGIRQPGASGRVLKGEEALV